MGVILVIGIFSWFAGNFKKMTTAYDPDGKGCGVDYPEYPYIYFASPHRDVQFSLMKSLWVTVCVKSCPKAGDSYLVCQPNSLVKTCTPKQNTDNTKSVEIYDSSVSNTYLIQPPTLLVCPPLTTSKDKSGRHLDTLVAPWLHSLKTPPWYW